MWIIRKNMMGLVLGKGWIMLHLSVQVESLWALRSLPPWRTPGKASPPSGDVGWALGGVVLSLGVWWAAWISVVMCHFASLWGRVGWVTERGQ